MAAMGEDFLHYTDMKKFLKNLLKPWSNLEIMSQDCSLDDPFQKLFPEILIGQKTWPPRGWGDFLH